MKRQVSIFGGVLLLGVLANLLLGASPAAVKPVAAPETAWEPVTMRVPDLAAADGVWEAKGPWGAVPKPVEPPPPPPPPPPVPVGIVGTGAARQAIFLISGVGELRVGVGGVLPDGGRVLEVSALQVGWVDGAGERHERRMFLDPAQPSGGTAGQPMAVPSAPSGMPATTFPPGALPPSAPNPPGMGAPSGAMQLPGPNSVR